MSTVVSVRTKTGTTYWYQQDVSGKKTRISAERALTLVPSTGTHALVGGGGGEQKTSRTRAKSRVSSPKSTGSSTPGTVTRVATNPIPVFNVAGYPGSGKTHLCEKWDDKDVATYDLDHVWDVAGYVQDAQNAGKKAVIFCGVNTINGYDRFANMPNVTKIWRDVSLDDWIARSLLSRAAHIDLKNQRKVAQAVAWLKEEDRLERKHPLPDNPSYEERYAMALEREKRVRARLEAHPSQLDELNKKEIDVLMWNLHRAWVHGYVSSIETLTRGGDSEFKGTHLAMGYVVVPEADVSAYIKVVLAATGSAARSPFRR